MSNDRVASRGMSETTDAFPADLLEPGYFVDSAHPRVVAFAQQATAAATSDNERASALFTAVRDGIRYNPYALRLDRDSFRASEVAQAETSWCVPKAVLLVAVARAVGIPARLGFADVRNHLSSPKLREHMGTDIFVYHGYAEMFIGGAWWKASPAFNRELCDRFGVPPLEFDGTADALLHAFDGAGRRHMEYVNDHGSFVDLPYEQILAALNETYGWALTSPDAADPVDSAFAP